MATRKSSRSSSQGKQSGRGRSSRSANQHERGGSHAQHVKAGRAGAAARWDHDSDKDNYERNQERQGRNRNLSEDKYYEGVCGRCGSSYEQQQRAGRSGWDRDSDEDNYDKDNRSRRGRSSAEDEDERGYSRRGSSYEQHQRAGRAGAAARWGRDYDEDENDYDEEDGRRGGYSDNDAYEYNTSNDYEEPNEGRYFSGRAYDEDEDDQEEIYGSQGGRGSQQYRESGRSRSESTPRYGRGYNEEMGNRGRSRSRAR